MNNKYFINAIRFVLLVLVQVLIFNQLNFFGFINPMVYILFLYWYPINTSRASFIWVSFLLGLCIDFFSDTMALHAASTVSLAYLRPTIMRFVYGVNIEFQNFKLSNSTRVQQFTFLALLIVVHHLVFFTLEIFSLANILMILKKVVVIGSASMLLCLLFNSLFSAGKE